MDPSEDEENLKVTGSIKWLLVMTFHFGHRKMVCFRFSLESLRVTPASLEWTDLKHWRLTAVYFSWAFLESRSVLFKKKKGKHTILVYLWAPCCLPLCPFLNLRLSPPFPHQRMFTDPIRHQPAAKVLMGAPEMSLSWCQKERSGWKSQVFKINVHAEYMFIDFYGDCFFWNMYQLSASHFKESGGQDISDCLQFCPTHRMLGLGMCCLQ